MANLTKEQRMAAKPQASDSTTATLTEPTQVDMYRDAPDHPAGPVYASVHQAEVQRWTEDGWRLVPDAED